MCTHDGNTNKGCYTPPDKYLGIFYVPNHPGYTVRCTTPTWSHPLWCDDLHLSGDMCVFTTQGRLFCFPKPCFFKNKSTSSLQDYL